MKNGENTYLSWELVIALALTLVRIASLMVLRAYSRAAVLVAVASKEMTFKRVICITYSGGTGAERAVYVQRTRMLLSSGRGGRY